MYYVYSARNYTSKYIICRLIDKSYDLLTQCVHLQFSIVITSYNEPRTKISFWRQNSARLSKQRYF